LFILADLKTSPLPAVRGELCGLSQPRGNSGIPRRRPVLQGALDDLGVRPERKAAHFARSPAASGAGPRLIIDGTDRRRHRPKDPGKQARHSSGKKKAHTDKHVVIVTLPRDRVDFLSPPCAGQTHDQKIADPEGITSPPEGHLVQGYRLPRG
jgi:hypothetical protein